LAAVFVLLNSFFIIGEHESAVLKRFSSVQSVYVREASDALYEDLAGDPKFSHVSIYEGAGLKWKVPFVDQVTKYDTRLITYDTPSRQVITAEKKKLLFDNNAQWRIVNPIYFDISMGTLSAAQTRIDSILYSLMNEKVGKILSHDLIADKDVVEQMLSELVAESSESLRSAGIEVYDIRIRRTDLPQENYESIYNRMITERNRIATQYRSEGDEEALEITSQTDREATILLSEANMKAEILKGEGDKEAARVFNEAYGLDPEFYEFYNTLETYKATLDDSATLVIPLDSPFARYLLGGGR